MQEMVCGSYAKPLKGAGLPYEPFAFADRENNPTALGLIYCYGGIKYAYADYLEKKSLYN